MSRSWGYIKTVVLCVWQRLPSRRWAIPSGLWAPTVPPRDAMVAVVAVHGEHGPEGRVVTFVRPFVAAVLIFDEKMARNLGGSAARAGKLVGDAGRATWCGRADFVPV